jgi:hypothetical protein
MANIMMIIALIVLGTGRARILGILILSLCCMHRYIHIHTHEHERLHGDTRFIDKVSVTIINYMSAAICRPTQAATVVYCKAGG